MTIVNVCMEHDRALIGFDTLSSIMPSGLSVSDAIQRLTAGGVHMSKCALMPHIGAAMAHLGDAMFATMLFGNLQLSMPRDFDHACELMPELLARTFTDTASIRQRVAGVDLQHGAQIVLVGWSPALKRMEGVTWTRWPQDKGFKGAPIGKTMLMPDTGWAQAPESPDTAVKMEAIAREQVAYVRAKHAGYNCGGRLLLAELTRDTLSVRTIADLEAPPQGAGVGQSLADAGS